MRSRLIIALLVGAVAIAALTPSAGGAPSAGSVRAKATSWAESQLGHREVGTSNCSSRINKWERDMGFKVPPCKVWCGALVHQAFLRAGVKLSPRIINPDKSYSDAVAGKRKLRRISISQIRRGDIVFYLFRTDMRASHLGIARGKPSGGKLRTVEGNTSHAVRFKTRGTQYIVLAARVVA